MSDFYPRRATLKLLVCQCPRSFLSLRECNACQCPRHQAQCPFQKHIASLSSISCLRAIGVDGCGGNVTRNYRRAGFAKKLALSARSMIML